MLCGSDRRTQGQEPELPWTRGNPPPPSQKVGFPGKLNPQALAVHVWGCSPATSKKGFLGEQTLTGPSLGKETPPVQPAKGRFPKKEAEGLSS